MHVTKLLSAALLITVAALPLAASSVSNLAQSLIELRQSVEQLHEQLDESKASYKLKMNSYNVQSTDLEANIAREELKIKQLQKHLKQIQARIKELSKSDKIIKPLALEGLQSMETVLEDALPFKRKERKAQIDELRDQIQANLITPQKALNRVWSIYEDNFRMSHENGLFRQNIVLNKKEYLANVVRLGTIMMFFKTSDGRVGYFKKVGGRYVVVEATSQEDSAHINRLFDSMKKQIRSGFFVLPNALSLGK